MSDQRSSLYDEECSPFEILSIVYIRCNGPTMSRSHKLISSFNAVSAIEKLIQPLLGSKASVKCVDCDGETRFVRDAVSLLNQLDIEHPVGQYIVSVCNGFFKRYKTGGDELLFFICQWTKAASLLCEMGVPTCIVIKLLREVVDECIEHVATQSIDITKLRSEQLEGKFETDSSANCVVLQDKGQSVSKKRPAKDRDMTVSEQHSETRHLVYNSEETKVRFNQGLRVGNDEEVDDTVTDDDFIDVILQLKTTGEGQEKNTRRIDLGKKSETDISQVNSFNCSMSNNINIHGTNENSNQAETLTKPTSHYEITSKLFSPNSSVDKSSVPVINLKMKNLQDNEVKGHDDDDDFSWFFEKDLSPKPCQNKVEFVNVSSLCENHKTVDVSSKLEGKYKTQLDDDDGASISYINDLSNKAINLDSILSNLCILNVNRYNGANHNNEHLSEDLDSELIRDINDLKKNIETELEILKKRSRSNGIRNFSKQNDKNEKNNDDTYGVMQDEFDDVWNEIEFENNHHADNEVPLSGNEYDEFVTIQFYWNKNLSIPVMGKEPGIESDSKHMEGVSKLEKMESHEQEQKDSFEDCIDHHKKDVLVIENLLKSLGKDRKLDMTFDKVLNNSRHFRTFQSVNSELNNNKVTASTDEKWVQTETLKDDKIDVGNGQNIPKSCTSSCNEPRNNTKSNGNISQENVLAKEFIKTPGQSLMTSQKQMTSGDKSEGFSHNKSNKDSISTVSGLNGLLQNLTLRNRTALSGKNYNAISAKPIMTQALSLRSRHFNCSDEEVLDISPVKVPDKDMELDYEYANGKQDDIFKTVEDHKIKSLIPECLRDIENKHVNESPRLVEVVRGLLHGSDEDLIDVICEIVMRLDVQENMSVLNKLVDCYTMCGLKRNPRLVQGLVLKTSIDCVTSVQCLDGKHCRVLLVNADMSPIFKHKGYKSMNVSTSYNVDSFYTHIPKSDRWTQQVTATLQKLSIDVILARGRVSDEMSSLCNKLNIVTMEMVPYRLLKLISDITEKDMGTYIQLVTEDNVCDGVKINHLSDNFMDKNVFTSDGFGEIVLTLPKSNPKTIVLFEMTPDLADLREQEFWDCLHQVTSCLQTGSILKRNTQTGHICLDFLKMKRDELLQIYGRSAGPSQYCSPLVYETIRDSFKVYSDMFYCKIEKPDYVYDDYLSKTAAWKVACDVVCTILNLEYYIITGLTNEIEAKKKLLTL